VGKFLSCKVLGFYVLWQLSLCLPSLAWAAVYYVSNTGSDANSGLATTAPWQTSANVNSTPFAPGDQILFERGGIFYGSITINASGVAGNPITFGAYGSGANPVITGFTPVTAWTNLGGNVWESATTVSALATCTMVAINGVNTPVGRYPNLGDANSGYLTMASHSGSTAITCSTLTGTPDWTGAEIVIKTNNWFLARGSVTSQTGSTLYHSTGVTPTDGYGFFLQNSLQTLDQPNEWYYNPMTHKIDVYSTSQPTDVKVASADNLFNFGYRSDYNWTLCNYVTIQNLDFTGANTSAFWSYPHLMTGHKLCGISIQNCNVSFTGKSAVYVQADPVTVTGNHILEANGSGIEVTYSGLTDVENNLLTSISLVKGAGAQYSDSAISAYNTTNTNTLRGNSVHNCGYNGIGFGGGATVVSQVVENYINTCCVKAEDGAAIYVIGPQGPGTTITRNICSNAIGKCGGTPYSGSMACGIYLDESTSNVEVSGNTAFDCGWAGLYVHEDNTCNFHDNILYNNGEQLRIAHEPNCSELYGNLINHNQFVSGNASQMVAGFSSDTNDLLSAGIFDNNYYAYPLVANGNVIFISEPLTGAQYLTISGWNALSGQDAHSTGAPELVTTAADIHFYYNATFSPTLVSLSEPMLDMKGTKYWSDITLQPYTSAVLVKDYHPTSPTPTATVTPVMPAPTISPTATVTPTVTLTATNIFSNVDLRGKFAVAFPNPATEQMQFLVYLPDAAEVKIVLYNASGRQVAQLRENLPAGQGQALTWRCREVAPGIYLAKVLVNGILKATLKVAVLGK
jgi:parallel beta-helix repeat protein